MKVRRCKAGKTSTGQSATGGRRGVLVVVVIVAMLVMSLLSLSIARTGIEQFRNVRRQQDRIQSQWLAQAGLERALAALEEDADYTGEVWSISAADLHASQGAEVTIRIESPKEDVRQRVVRVSSEFPAAGTFRHRTTRSLLFPPTSGSGAAATGVPADTTEVPPPPLPEPVEAAP